MVTTLQGILSLAGSRCVYLAGVVQPLFREVSSGAVGRYLVGPVVVRGVYLLAQIDGVDQQVQQESDSLSDLYTSYPPSPPRPSLLK